MKIRQSSSLKSIHSEASFVTNLSSFHRVGWLSLWMHHWWVRLKRYFSIDEQSACFSQCIVKPNQRLCFLQLTSILELKLFEIPCVSLFSPRTTLLIWASQQTLLFECDQSVRWLTIVEQRVRAFLTYTSKKRVIKNISHAGLNFNRATV